MLEDLLDDLLILDHADDLHGTGTFGTGEGINLIDFLDKPCPVLPALFGRISDSRTEGISSSSSGTMFWKNTFRESHAHRLSSERSLRS
jgi:hypothetical protein